MVMQERLSTVRGQTAGGLPFTPEAHRELLSELGRTELAFRDGLAQRRRELQSIPEESVSSSEAELSLLATRLETLKDAAAAATVVARDGGALVGSRVTIRRANATTDVTYEIVAPGLGDVQLGRISAESALGRTLLGRGPGEEVIFFAPAGEQRLTIIDVQ